MDSMHFDLKQFVTDAGERHLPNEDRCGLGNRVAWVLDGATDLGPIGLMGDRSGAAWWAMRANEMLAGRVAHFRHTDDLRTLLSNATVDLGTAYRAERLRAPLGAWERPSGAFMAVSITGRGLEVAWAGDCTGILLRNEEVLRIAPSTAYHETQAAIAASDANPDYLGAAIAPALMDRLRGARGAVTGLALDVDTKAKGGFDASQFKVQPGDELVLMTDGYTALSDKYGIALKKMVAQMHTIGLHGVLSHLRQIELDDLKGHRFPRFKASDDATAIWIKISGEED